MTTARKSANCACFVSQSSKILIYVLYFVTSAPNTCTYIKIPDNWRRKQEELSLFRAIFSYVIPILFFTGLGLTALIVFLKNLKSEAARSVPWRRIALWSIWGLLGYLAVFFLGNRVPSFL